MKKKSVNMLVGALLLLLSAASFVFLNSVTIEAVVDEPASAQHHQLVQPGEEGEQILLPDVALIKKALETAKRFIPAF